jgi:hypothetical protein
LKVIKHILSTHTILLLYFLVFCLLLNGIVSSTGGKHIDEMLLFFGVLVVSYVCFFIISKKINLDVNKIGFLNKIQLGKMAFITLPIISICFILIHFIYLGGSPALDSLNHFLVSEVAGIRRSITSDSHGIINYMASFNLKAIIPFSLLFLLIKNKKRLYWILYVLACFYAFSLMQKSYIITLSIPIIIYALARRKYLLIGKYIIVITGIIVSLVFVANPQFRGGTNDSVSIVEDVPVKTEVNPPPYIIRVFRGLSKRVLFVPGKTVGDWFENIPSKKPFLNGTGYRFYAKLSGKEYHNYAQELYPILYPKHVEKGFHGNVNVASFMYDYSNFGKSGLVLAGIILALIFVFIESLFENNILLKICLNAFPIFMLSSSALTILLFSGGWGLMIILFFLFKKHLNSSYV